MTGYFCCRSSMAELDEKSIPRRILRQGMNRIGEYGCTFRYRTEFPRRR